MGFVIEIYPRAHYVAAVLISTDIVIYMDSLNPGSEPNAGVVRQIEASFNLKKKYCIRSAMCQKQGLADCLPFVLANLDAILAAADITKVKFPKKYVRAFFVKSLIYRTLSFPSKSCNCRGNDTVFVMRAK